MIRGQRLRFYLNFWETEVSIIEEQAVHVERAAPLCKCPPNTGVCHGNPLVIPHDSLVYLTDSLVYFGEINENLTDSLVYLTDSLVYFGKENENLTDLIVYSARFWFILTRFSFISAK
jgi:hypothetical protein